MFVLFLKRQKKKLSFETVNVQRRGSAMKLVYEERKMSELHRAKQAVKDFLKYVSITIESGFDEIAEDVDWKKLQRSVEASGKLSVLRDVSKHIHNC